MKPLTDYQKMLLSFVRFFIRLLLKTTNGTATRGMILFGIENIITFYITNDDPYKHYALINDKHLLYFIFRNGGKSLIYPSTQC